MIPIIMAAALQCAPGRADADDDDVTTCLTIEELRDIARRYNAVDGNQKVRFDKKTGKRELVKELQHAMSRTTKCSDDQLCWAETMRSNAVQAFRPRMPREWAINRYEWLSNWDITETLSQYARAHDFYHLVGVFMSDFASMVMEGDRCMEEVACSLPLAKPGLYGFVINVDTSRGPGIHWVSLLVCPDRERGGWFGFTYYDPVGNPVIPGVQRYIDELKKRNPFVRDAPTHVVLQGGRRHQHKNSECGMFCIMHHHHAIEHYEDHTYDPKDYADEDTDDQIANMKRFMFFNPPADY